MSFLIAGSPFLFGQKLFMNKQGPLNSINLKKSEDRLDVDIVFFPYTSHRKFFLVDPDRLVIDLMEIHEIRTSRLIEINDYGVLRIRVGSYKPNIVRVVFDLDEKNPRYRIQKMNEGLRVVFLRKEAPAGKKEEIPSRHLEMPEKKDIRQEGIKAEMEEDWERALEIYESMPEREELWIRIANIKAKLNRFTESAEAIGKAIQISPEKPDLYFRQAQAYSVAEEPGLALVSIKKALAHAPANIEYLHYQASLANWLAEYETSVVSFREILTLVPYDTTAQLGLARVLSWEGHLGEAVDLYRKYLEKDSENKNAWIEYSRVEAWRGNYPAALDILEEFRKRFGKTTEYYQEKARILAWAMRPRAALSIIRTVLKEAPDNYELNITNTIALKNGKYTRESLKSLEKVIQLKPESPQTEMARRFVLTPMRPNVIPGFSYYTDTSDLTIFRELIEGGFLLQKPTRLKAGIQVERLNSKFGSGLEQFNGKDNALHEHAWIGMHHQLIPSLGLYGQLGRARIERGQEVITTYKLRGDFWPKDNLSFQLERSSSFFVVSPRTVGLGIKRDLNQLRLQWEPEIRYHVDANLTYASLSDTNRFWEVILAPRRIIVRNENYNLDLGLGAWLFGYKYSLNNGYYSPTFYQRYMVTSFGYWKITDNDGINFMFTAGAQKDNNQDRFRFSATAEIEGTFGIYRSIMLKINGGFFELRLDSGAFRAYIFRVGLTGRF